MAFMRAERKKAKLRMALCGPAGSGKTYSSILIAKGIGGKIAMIDTENHSGELYADLTDYDVATLGAPYSPERYVQLIKEAESAGYDVLIIDSLSHGWSGSGGVLEMVDKATRFQKSNNSYTAWRDVTPAHNKLVEAMLQSRMHIISTIRSKTEYAKSTGEDGKMKIEKLGLAPIQRDGLDYEFTVVLDLNIDGHVAKASKDRTSIFDGKFVTPNETTGKDLLYWLNEGKEVEPEPVNAELEPVDEAKLLESMKETLRGAETLDDLKALWVETISPNARGSGIYEEIAAFKDKRKKEIEALTIPPDFPLPKGVSEKVLNGAIAI